ncbi:MAG: 16S rRNA (uracil(1498)-N(3))-methyltransferase [Lysobacteraceae bacterium]|nr:MAG: 16S rRNA (uracil(1498)-N(3))-methyltransferase [Xanthomonadaceae bacterium]
MPRLYCPAPLAAAQSLVLPPQTARHVQVLRLQPGDALTLFNGEGGEWTAVVERMGRSDVEVAVQAHTAVEREATRAIHLAVGMPANERMDWLVEKATELGVASIQPLQTAHSVLRLSGERAAKKQLHWQAVAQSACEQCGRNRVPLVHAPADFGPWLTRLPRLDDRGAHRAVLSLREPAATLAAWHAHSGDLLCLSGPEGGLSASEEDTALAQGFAPLSLGTRVLRAETAAIAVLAALAG